jgi:hypothetical protein
MLADVFDSRFLMSGPTSAELSNIQRFLSDISEKPVYVRNENPLSFLCGQQHRKL